MTMFSDGMLLGVGGDSPLTYVEASAFVTGVASGGVSLNKPTNTAVGDLMVAVVWINSATPVVEPGGWTLIASDFTANIGVGVYIKEAGGAEPSSYSFSGSAGTIIGQILLLRGGTGALDNAGAFASSSNTVSTANGFTAAHAGVHIAMFAIRNAGRTISTPPAGMTQVGFNNAANGTCATYIIDPSAAGSVPTKTLTWSGTATTQSGIALQVY